MSWRLFRWTWRLEGPLFVGVSPAGALNRCRLYVPARVVWGAVTAELTRLEADSHPNYGDVGKKLRRYGRFSYLYPAELVSEHWCAWLPEYREKDGLVWVREGGDTPLTDRLFRRRLLSTRSATAIDPENDAALDGSLRETECVQLHWRPDDDSVATPVGMVGYVFLRNGESLPERLSGLRTLFVGGDTRYGLGRLESEGEMKPDERLFGATVDLDNKDPCVVSCRLLAHAEPNASLEMSGDEEALGGWDMTDTQREPRISGPLWAPGSRAAPRDGPPRFRIDEDGIWHLDADSTPQAPSNGAPSS